MLPDIDLRLQAIASTLRDIVLPAVPESEQLAREHVTLIIAHLSMIQPQWKAALKFELGTYDLQCELARELRPLLDDSELSAEIGRALDAATRLDRLDYDEVSRALKDLGRLTDRAVNGDYTTTPMDPRLLEAVIDYGKREAWRYRVWFAGAQIDPDLADLPGIDSLFEAAKP